MNTPKKPDYGKFQLEALCQEQTPEDMQDCLERRILAWNRGRNGFEFDMDLEISMLKEELREFLNSASLYNMLREYADFLFVYTGSNAKYMAAKFNTVEGFVQQREKWAEVQSWARDAMEAMKQILVFQLSIYGLDPDTQILEVFDRCLEAVVEANENKGTEKDESGKIKKGPNYVPPEETIQEILRETIGRVE